MEDSSIMRVHSSLLVDYNCYLGEFVLSEEQADKLRMGERVREVEAVYPPNTFIPDRETIPPTSAADAGSIDNYSST